MEWLSDLTARRMEQERALDAARLMRCAIHARRGGGSVADLFERHYPQSTHVGLVREHVIQRTKALVPGMDASTAGELLPVSLSRALIALSAPFAILPRLGAVAVPFISPVPVESAASIAGSWIDTGMPKPVKAGAFSQATLARRCAATIVVIADELTKFASINTEALLANRLSRGIAAFLDRELCDPLGAYSVTSGSPMMAIASGGNVATDLAAVLHVYPGAVETCVIIMSSRNAIGARLQNPELCRDLSRQGGTIGGLPCVASDSAGSVMIAVDVARLLVADAGELSIDTARSASIAMDDEPQGSPSSGGTSLISMFQADMIALRCERFVNWQMADAASVAFVNSADYLASVGSP